MLRRTLALPKELFITLAKIVTRAVAFLTKEITEVVRRPGVLFSLVLGPFIIMTLFGFGYSGVRRPLDTVMVVPADSVIPRDAAYYQQLAGAALHIVDVTDGLDAPREKLARQQIDLVVSVPSGMEERFKSGQQSVITVDYNQSDPIRDAYIRIIADRQVQELNRTIVQEVVAEGQNYAVQTLHDQAATQIPPEVVAAPTKAETKNFAPITPSITDYYAPAVLALVLQHMAITLTALSLVRERLSGAIDIFRVAPVGTMEILVGKYLAYGFLNMAVAGVVALLLTSFLGVPMLGSTGAFFTVLLMLTFASLGLGLLISTLADSERQAVQLSMLVLLASVFMSGFVLPLDEFLEPVRSFGYLLPVTYGIRLLQDIMLRGTTNALWEFWALAGFGVVLFLITAVALRRDLAKG